jgi:hypothetical protein
VGAIWIDEQLESARVEPPHPDVYDQVEMSPSEFSDCRSTISQALQPEGAPFEKASLVSSQVRWATGPLQSLQGQRILRLIGRNTFLIASAAARLKNVGDNNAACELLVDDGQGLLLVEIEPGGDTLDALRRVLAGSAIATSRLAANLDDLTAALIVGRLPNKRADYYAVVNDVRSRLGIEILTVPLAFALLGIRAGGEEFPDHVRTIGSMSDADAPLAIEKLYGSIDDPIAAGLLPPK